MTWFNPKKKRKNVMHVL